MKLQRRQAWLFFAGAVALAACALAYAVISNARSARPDAKPVAAEPVATAVPTVSTGMEARRPAPSKKPRKPDLPRSQAPPVRYVVPAVPEPVVFVPPPPAPPPPPYWWDAYWDDPYWRAREQWAWDRYYFGPHYDEFERRRRRRRD